MKVIWEAADITPGRRYGKPGGGQKGFIRCLYTTIGEDLCVTVSAHTGMVGTPRTKEQIAQLLTDSGYMPVELLLEIHPDIRREQEDSVRYRWLRERDLESIHKGGIFVGMMPQKIVMNGDDLDFEVDAAMALELAPNDKTVRQLAAHETYNDNSGALRPVVRMSALLGQWR